MMVETILESSQDFAGMSGGALPQWKRELLQRRAARSRPPAPPLAPPPPPPPPADDDEELRYGPGIVKRLKSRYLSLALRDAPRRRPSVLRRATSLEHLLDDRPPPAPRPAARAPRPASLAVPPHSYRSRRDFVKRARSVDALSRLEPRDEPPQSPPPPPPAVSQPPVVSQPPAVSQPPVVSQPPAVPQAPVASSPPPAAPPPPPPAPPRPSARPPRRPAPLLRETERPPPDLVRSTLRKFEPAPVRRTAPAARVSAALRGLERGGTPTPEPRSPSPASPGAHTPDARRFEEPEATSTPRPVSRAALEGIARAGSSTRYSFEAPKRASHLPPLAATNPVMLGRARRVGVIRPMPAPPLERAPPAPPPPAEECDEKTVHEPPRIADAAPRIFEEPPRTASPPAVELEPSPRPEKRTPPPSALVEPIPRSPPDDPPPSLPRSPPPPAPRETTPEPVIVIVKTETKQPEMSPKPKIRTMTNGHAESPRVSDVKPKDPVSRVGSAEVERGWNGVTLKKTPVAEPKPTECVTGAVRRGGARGAGAGARGAPAAPPSVVFNFSHRKEVPDYIENDGLILRASRRDRIKCCGPGVECILLDKTADIQTTPRIVFAGEPGVVVLRPELLAASDDDDDLPDCGPPSPCCVRFVNDNVLINGRSCMGGARDRDRAARLKLQFDDSLTRTFEYPSETSLCEDGEETDAPAPLTALVANTHLVSGALGRYTPHKTCADSFQLGVTRHTAPPTENGNGPRSDTGAEGAEGAECGEAGGDARPCGADAARSWSEARTLATDLLF